MSEGRDAQDKYAKTDKKSRYVKKWLLDGNSKEETHLSARNKEYGHSHADK